MILKLLAAGASKGLVAALQSGFVDQTGLTIDGTFTAAGAIRDKVIAGDPCDVIILTHALLEALVASGHATAPIAPIGLVRTGIGVPTGQPHPAIATVDDLRATLLTTGGLYVPDPEISTAGVHVIRVLKQLGIEPQVRPNLRPFPNGATAMRALTQAPETNAIGCTQITEIIDTPGLTVVGPLPDATGLATIYSTAIRATTAHSAAAKALVALLTGPATADIRAACGFE